MLCDYHIHSRMCGDAVGSFEEYIQCALERGVSEIGFSGHCPQYYYPPGKRTNMCSIPDHAVGHYLQELELLRENYQKIITVRIGLEIDYIPGKEKLLRPIIDLYEWDYLLLSVHFLGDWPFDDPAYLPIFHNQNIAEIYRYYYRILIQGMLTGWFDIVAHFDLPKKFGHRLAEPICEEEEALKVCLEKGLTLEMNTAGFRKPVGEAYPSRAILRKASGLGIPICLGSDAHRPGEVSQDFDQALVILREAGFRELAGFHKRELFRYPIPDGIHL